MHADAFYRNPDDREGGLTGPLIAAVALHVAVALLFWLGWWWSPQRQVEAAAGSPVIEASLEFSQADVQAAQARAEQAPKPEPLPAPVAEPAPEDTVPPPQPLLAPRPQDAPTTPQQKAQDFIVEPDTVDQDEARRDAVAREMAEREQEERRRQEQIDLTERERQKEAETQRRLAAQAEQAERDKKLAEIRRQREQAARQAQLAEQRLRQLQQAQQRPAQATASQGTPGQGGTSDDLTAKYAAAIQQAVLNQWIRPDTVPLGQTCTLLIRQLPGGEVMDAKVDPSCPYDEAGKRSLEAAVLRAQPLPYRGFESVFNRNLVFHFQAQDR